MLHTEGILYHIYFKRGFIQFAVNCFALYIDYMQCIILKQITLLLYTSVMCFAIFSLDCIVYQRSHVQ